MQNVQTSLKDNLDQDSALPQQSNSASLEAVHSDPGSRPKIKSRSRFSTAIRKLSGSTRKKERSTQKASPEAVISSGGEEPDFGARTTTSGADSKEKKKSRLSKRFLLSSLSKKSKVSPKTSIDADDDNEERTAALDAFLSAEQEKKAAAEEGDSPTKGAKPKQTTTTTVASTGKQSKVQITISGKKADESLRTDLKAVRSTTISSDAETAKGKPPKEAYSEATVKAFTTVDAAAKAKKKLKTKKTPTAATVTGVSTKKAKPKETEAEKLVVTHSTCDTPPSESAPLKPSRSATAVASATLSPANANNEASTIVRKATTRAAATLTSPSLTQRLIGSSVKAKKQRANTLAADEANISPDAQTTSAPQRGFRFSRSTTTTAPSSIIQPATSTTTSKPTATTSIDASKQRQLQFQLKSESQSKTQASKDTSATAKLSQPPTQSISPAQTPELRSSILNTSRQQLQLAAARISNSSGQDDFVSSAESAAFQAGYEARPTSQELSDEATEAALRIAARSLRKQNTVGSYASNLSSSSESQASTASRQHTHTVREPIMFDTENRKKSNDDLSLQDNEFDDTTMDEETETTTMTATNGKKREHLYKILVIGEAGTGKTSFIKRYVHQFFSQNYRATIGVDFALKVLQWDDDTIVRLQLWDIAGQERFGNMTRVYYKEAVGAFIVFDVTRNGTFDCVSKWKEDLDSKVQLPDGNPIPCILLANKCDQEKQGIASQPEKIEKYVQENGFSGWFETSAKENINIDEAARALVSKILLNDKLIAAGNLADNEKLNLIKSANEENTAAKNRCPC